MIPEEGQATRCALWLSQCAELSQHHTLHPIPYTIHPTPYTLHPTPYTLHPTPYTLHPTPCTLHPTHPKPYILHPTPYTLHPTPYTLNPPRVRRGSGTTGKTTTTAEAVVPEAIGPPRNGQARLRIGAAGARGR